MNDQWGYEEDTNGTDLGNDRNDGPKALRDAYAAMKKQNDELNAKLTGFLEDQKKQTLATVFQSLGAPGAENLYQGEADPGKAKAWVESMRGVFGGNNAQGTAPVADSAPTTPALEPDTQAQYQRMTEAGQNGAPIGGFEAAQAAVNDATDLTGLIASFQNSVRNI